ncbi:MAG: single-stranded-DNA-specific exonuclease RecJ [Armatimonadetes bacterium]|nr:single-stranded-DNA-specific exonuclease RecJ [Armatimonadota bacterium]
MNRGLSDPAAAAAFLDCGLDRLSSPFDLAGMDHAAARLAQAVRDQERVAIYGDYDADGVTATAILVRGLRSVGVAVEYYVPDRRAEGYGLHPDAVARLASEGAEVLVAVDCGISAPSAAEAARSAGLDLIVLDHHEPTGPLPEAAAVVHPQRHVAGAAPGTEYCAAGLAYQAWRALCVLLERHDDDGDGDLLELAALGTVADMAPLLGDNRILVARGLERMGSTRVLGLRALMEVAALLPPLGVRDLSHGLAPRINAAGRLAHAADAVRLLTTEDPEEAEMLARRLDGLNRERRALCEQVLAEAIGDVEARGLQEQPALVLAREGWHPGVVGIVASQLVERYYRPAVLIALQEGLGKGSARSIPPVHMVEALSHAAAHVTAFGGHAMAAGLTIPAGAVEGFRSAFLAAVAGKLRDEDLEPVVQIDAEIPLEAATLEQAAELGRLAPFGSGNEPPVFATSGLRVHSTRLVGDGAHLRMVVGDGTLTAEAIAFRQGDLAELLAFTQARVDLAYSLEESRWREVSSVRLVVRDLRTPGLKPAEVTSSTAQLLGRLFERADDYLDLDRREVEEADAFHTKVVGVTFEGRQATLASVRAGEALRLVRDPQNPRDPHAIKVCLGDGRQLGFLRAALAARLAPAMDAGARYAATATALTGGGDRAWGLNIHVNREATWEGEIVEGRRGPLEGLVSDLSRGRTLSGRQQEVLDAVLAGSPVAARFGPGRNLLPVVVMAAAALVSRGDGPVVVVLPRSAVVDAWYGLAGMWLRGLGLRVAGAHGLLPAQDTARICAAWGRGDLDLLFASALWTELRVPEAGGVVAVFDPHSPESDIALLRERYGGRLRLLAGTLPFEALAQAAAAVGIDRVVAAGPARTNLRVVDRRGLPGEEIGLATGRARQEKVLVLTDDAGASVTAARHLRTRHPDMADLIAYYHAGLPSALRRVIEDLFAAGQLTVLVAGAHLVAPALPEDIARVVVLGLPTDPLLAGDCMGSGGLKGQATTVELRFGPDALDAAAARLEARCPSRETLVRCYHELRARGRAGAGSKTVLPKGVLSACLAIMVEAGILTREDAEGSGGLYTLLGAGARGDLGRSLRYREGMREHAAWSHLRAWAGGPAARILDDLSRP